MKFFNLIKSIYIKATPNSILNDERLNASHLRLGKRQKMFFLTTCIQIVLEFLASTKRQEKGDRLEQKKVKLPLFADNLIVDIENLNK